MVVPKTRYAKRNILITVPGGEGSVMVWGCISYDYKLNLITIPGTLNVHKYCVNVLKPSVVPHYDDHTLASRPIFMDDNTTSCQAVTDYLQESAIETLLWPVRTPNLNCIENFMGYLWPPGEI